ncbi:MAG: hypothetical protein O7H41_19230, partial [Planctomycetota bacterium]|nr:hypothetical protein [Planctomycetota bacterium]
MTQGRLLLSLAILSSLIVSGILWNRSCSRSAGPGTGGVRVAAPEGFVLREVGERSGVTIRTICGPPKDKKFIIEANGSGAALFDYDLDGDLDLYVINGSTIEILREDAPAVRNALYRNDGEWRF